LYQLKIASGPIRRAVTRAYSFQDEWGSGWEEGAPYYYVLEVIPPLYKGDTVHKTDMIYVGVVPKHTRPKIGEEVERL
jgi:hypothetical protein